MSFVLYRLPDDTTPVLLQGHTEEWEADQEPGKGFLLAPFANDRPALIIRPESISEGIPSSLDFAWGGQESIETPNYEETFSRFHQALCEGRFQKLVLSQPFQRSLLPPLPLYHHLCQAFPHSMVYLLHTPQSGTWIGATPEVLIRNEQGTWTTMALAGTNFSADTPWDEKNREEQAIVTRYIRQALEPYAQQLQESAPHTLQTGKIYHLCTDFRFQLKPGTTLGPLVRSLHPTPAVCGLPKDEAWQYILQQENYDRQYYAGYLGPCNLQGKTSLHVNIRCARYIAPTQAIVFAGSGLLAESTYPMERKEIERKSEQLI